MSRRFAPALLLITVALSACGKREAEAPSPAATPKAAAPSAPRATLEAGVTLQALESGPLEPSCSVETVVQLGTDKPYPMTKAVYTVDRDAAVKLIGFATQKTKAEALGSFTALLASPAAVYKVQGQTEFERPDVVTFFKAPGMLKSGFHLNVDLKDVPAGDYAIFLRSSAGLACPTHHTIKIQG